jgi:3-deoxy-7-phosphoheptulonate synthase
MPEKGERMLVVMKHGASEAEVQAVVDEIEQLGYEAHPMPGKQRTTVGLMGNDGGVDAARIQGLLGVLKIIPVTKPYKRVSREWRDSDTIVELGNGVRFGGEEINIIAGPCAVEGEAEILDIAHQLKASGATVLRGGAFKPRNLAVLLARTRGGGT